MALGEEPVERGESERQKRAVRVLSEMPEELTENISGKAFMGGGGKRRGESGSANQEPLILPDFPPYPARTG